MATENAAASAAVPADQLTVGMIVQFKGYTDASVEPIFQPGQRIRVDSVDSANGAGTATPEAGGPGDTFFFDEIELIPATVAAPAAAAAEAPAAAPAPAAKAPRKNAKAKAAAPAAEAPAAAPAPAVKAETPAAAPAPAAEAPAAAPAPIKTTRAKKAAAPAAAPAAPAEVQTAPVNPVAVADSATVAAVLAESDALEAAKTLVAQVEESYFTLGGVLSHIYNEGIFKSAGYDGKRGFANYVEKELGIQYRKAMYLIDIYTAFRRLGVDEKRLTQIGWSKAKELTKIATPENFNDLIEYAQSHTRDEVIAHVQTSTVTTGGEAGEQVRKTKLNFTLFADQATTVERALAAAKSAAGTDDPNQALEHICAEWAMANEGVEVPIDEAIRALERKYKVTLAVETYTERTEGDATSGEAAEHADASA